MSRRRIALRRGFLRLDAGAGRAPAPRRGRRQCSRHRAYRRGDRGLRQKRAARLPIALRAHHRAPAEARIFGSGRTGPSLAQGDCRVAASARRKFTRSLLAKMDLQERYRYALRLLRAFEHEMPELIARVSAERPYSLDQILSGGDEDWFPAAG